MALSTLFVPLTSHTLAAPRAGRGSEHFQETVQVLYRDPATDVDCKEYGCPAGRACDVTADCANGLTCIKSKCARPDGTADPRTAGAQEDGASIDRPESTTHTSSQHHSHDAGHGVSTWVWLTVVGVAVLSFVLLVVLVLALVRVLRTGMV